jgi:acyl-coenzyme A thioesterase PaaI-like protein
MLCTSLNDGSYATLSVQSRKHAFVKRMEFEPGFEETTTLPRRLNTPALLNVSRRTWIERTGKAAISIFCLDTSHTGYTGLVHGGILAALVDEACAEYCNRGALALYSLTKSLSIDFEKPSPMGGIFIAKASTSRSFPLTASDSKKVWVKCEVSVLQGEDKVIPVVKASALFILCEKLPWLPSCGEAGNSVEDLFTYERDESVPCTAPMRTPRDTWRVLVLIAAALVVGIWGFLSMIARELSGLSCLSN